MREDGQNIGEWHRSNSPQYGSVTKRHEEDQRSENRWRRDVMEYISHEPVRDPKPFSAWGCAWRIALATLVVYVLLTAALVLTHHA